MFDTYLTHLKHMLNITHILHMYFADVFKICINHMDLNLCLIHVKHIFYLWGLEYVFNTCDLLYVYVTPSIITYMCFLSPRFVIKGNTCHCFIIDIYSSFLYFRNSFLLFFCICTLFTYVFIYVIYSNSHKHAGTFPISFTSNISYHACFFTYGFFFKCLSYL